MLQDKLHLKEVAEELGCDNCAQAFAALKLRNGNRWAAIMLDQIKHHKSVFPTLTDMYNGFTADFGSHGRWPLGNYEQSKSSRVEFIYEDIFPHDGSIGFVRYTKVTTTQDEGTREDVYKMKIGKAVRASLESMTNMLGEKALIYMTERATSEWIAQQQSEENYELKIDEDFGFIYNSDNYAGSIHSCQSDGGNYGFYKLINGAKAASLLDSDGNILCRAILFTEIHHRDDESKILRGIERMYSVDGRMDYKQIFLNRLKKDGWVDIYKDFNAGAYDERSWRTLEDEPYREPIYVALKRALDDDDPVSWMDTFYMTDGVTRCCNYSFGQYEIRNSDHGVTWYDIIDEGAYDEYLEEYVHGIDSDDLVRVYYNGREIYVCERTRENHFPYCQDDDEYHHEDEAYWSEHDECYYFEAIYSEHYHSYISKEEAREYYTEDGGTDYAYEDDLYELEDGNYMLEDTQYMECNGIRYKAIEIV